MTDSHTGEPSMSVRAFIDAAIALSRGVESLTPPVASVRRQRSSGAQPRYPLLDGVDERFCRFEVGRFEALGEPVVDWSEERHGIGGRP